MMSRSLIGLGVAAACGAGALTLLYHATYNVRSQLLGETVWRGRTDTNAVALTFDDGPSLDTPAVLDALREQRVKATFFLIGRQTERFPQIAQRIVAEGHEVGNHSYSHPIYLFRSGRETRRQLERTQAMIEQTTGVRATFSRPPCGVRTWSYFRAARELGLRTVQWSVAGFDWQRLSASEIADKVLKDVQAGSIILLHDGDSINKHDRRETVKAVPLIIAGLRERKLRVAPLREVLANTENVSCPLSVVSCKKRTTAN
jgi:peptidoglycan/xylan/chitin deacetylase (PgdA/CDA1 family)